MLGEVSLREVHGGSNSTCLPGLDSELGTLGRCPGAQGQPSAGRLPGQGVEAACKLRCQVGEVSGPSWCMESVGPQGARGTAASGSTARPKGGISLCSGHWLTGSGGWAIFGEDG